MRLAKYTLAIVIGAMSVLPPGAMAQTSSAKAQASSQPAFEVVSVRPMKEGDNTPTHITNSPYNGYFKAIHVNLKDLLEVTSEIPDTRMFGGPGWATKERFSLEATADSHLDEYLATLTKEQGREIKRKMLAALLADRFKLVIHTETREMPIYAMVVAKGGSKLDAAGSSVAVGGNRIMIDPGGNSLAFLAYELSWRLGRPVLDHTGLQYKQRLVLSWKDDEETSGDSTGPSVFTAIQEQLGLKLEPAKGPLSVLVIDHAERPTGN